MKEVTVKLKGHLARLLAWCAKAISTDDGRPPLTGLYIDMGGKDESHAIVMTSDGIRMHILEVPREELERLALEDGTWIPWTPIKATEHINELQSYDGAPNPLGSERTQELLDYLDKEPVVAVRLQARYLMDALKHLDKGSGSSSSSVTIKLFAKDEVAVLELWSSKDMELGLSSRKAIIMPMHFGG